MLCPGMTILVVVGGLGVELAASCGSPALNQATSRKSRESEGLQVLAHKCVGDGEDSGPAPRESS